MIKCPVCQTKNTDEALYCKKCCVKMSAAIEAARRIQTKDARVLPVCPPDNMKVKEIVYKTYPKKEIRNLMIEKYSKLHPKREVIRIIRVFEKHIKAAGAENVLENFGEMCVDRILEGKGHFNQSAIYANIDNAIADGATRADIMEYYDLFLLQIMMVEWSEQIYRHNYYLLVKATLSLSEDEALVEVAKMYPMYGIANDATHFQGEDRMLSPILRGRVDRYRTSAGPENMTNLARVYSSFNACVRDFIRNGLI